MEWVVISALGLALIASLMLTALAWGESKPVRALLCFIMTGVCAAVLGTYVVVGNNEFNELKQQCATAQGTLVLNECRDDQGNVITLERK